MSMLDSALSLIEMEQELENAIQKRNGKIRTLGDLELTNEDYKILSLRFRGFGKYQRNLKLFERYSLALITAGAYVFQYEQSSSSALEKIYMSSEQIPQYMKRKIIEIFDNTIREFNLSTFGIDITDLHTLIEVLLLHSYNNETVYQKYFAALDKCSDGEYTEEYMADVNALIFTREEEILDKKIQERVFSMYQRAYLDCAENGLTEKELLFKYPSLSWLFISSCCKWCQQREAQGMMKIVK